MVKNMKIISSGFISFILIFAGCVNIRGQVFYRSVEKNNIAFLCPPSFVVGKFNPIGVESFDDAIVLVEPLLLGSHNVNSIPVGVCPAIAIYIQKGKEAKFTLTTYCEEESKQAIGEHIVYKAVEFPGPFGEDGYYYVIQIASDYIINIIGTKKKNSTIKDKRENTDYDQIIEGIIKTLKTKK